MSTYLNTNGDGVKYEYWKETLVNVNSEEEYNFVIAEQRKALESICYEQI